MLEVKVVSIQYTLKRYRSKINESQHTPVQMEIFYISFLANLQCISILFPIGHENLLSVWDTHCRFPFQPLEFTALDRTQWYSINWSIVVQFTKYEWTKINLLKRLTRKKDSPYIFLISFLNLNEKSTYFYLYTCVGYSTRSL